jgi:hypothetical protein
MSRYVLILIQAVLVSPNVPKVSGGGLFTQTTQNLLVVMLVESGLVKHKGKGKAIPLQA